MLQPTEATDMHRSPGFGYSKLGYSSLGCNMRRWELHRSEVDGVSIRRVTARCLVDYGRHAWVPA